MIEKQTQQDAINELLAEFNRKISIVCTPGISKVYISDKQVMINDSENHHEAAAFAGLMAIKLGYAVTLTNLDTPLNLETIQDSALKTVRFLAKGVNIPCDQDCPICAVENIFNERRD